MTQKKKKVKAVEFVTCEECGNEQADMGNSVACEKCGYGPMPTNPQSQD